jgi:hypothetical protein
VTTPDIAAVQAAAMAAENRRRELGGQSPGLGALLPLEQPPADAGQGSPPVVGEGYSVTAAPAPAQVYVPHGVPVYGDRTHYADPLVGGYGFQAGRSEPAVRHVMDIGDGALLIEGASAPAANPFTVVSPPAKPGLLARLAGRLRGRR